MQQPDGPPQASPPAPTTVVETHISTLFFVGDRVFKLHKPVDLGFLDFSDREARRADCEREVALNRRLAPDVYLGVADVVVDGVPLDHLVVMRRLPEQRRLTVVLAAGVGVAGCLGRVAGTLVDFHRHADRSPAISADASATALRGRWESDFADVDPFVGTLLDGADEDEIRRRALRWVDGRTALLEARISAGRVCDGHGDLQADDVFCLEDGVRILDCLEFSDRLRFVDVCADVAFLAMDLEHRGFPGAAADFLDAYQEAAGDRFPPSLLHHYVAARAYVRAKVSCLQADQGAPGAAGRAREFHRIALDHLRRATVALVLVGGLPGSGKSTLADGLAAERGWTVLHSDEIRREAGGPVARRIAADPQGRYGPAATGAVYGELLDRAEQALGRAETVVLDASWIGASRRDAARDVAARTSSELAELRCEVAPDEADRRIRRRLAHGATASEATPRVRAAMAERMDPWDTATVIDTSRIGPADAVAVADSVLASPWGLRR